MPKVMRVRGGNAPRRVFISIPAYSGAVGAECVVSTATALGALERAGMAWELCVEVGNCHVDDARNSAVQQFFETDCTDLVFIDEDVGYRADDLVRLLSVDADVVAGVYPKKQDDTDFPVLCLPGERWSNAEGLVEVEGAPTGFMRISRKCLETLCKASKSYEGQNGATYHIIFERNISGGKRRSGDYAFCYKWRKLGGKIFVAPEMRFSHTGNKTWGGCLGDFWRRQAKLPSPRVTEAINKLKAGDATHEVLSQLFDAWDNPYSALPDHLMASYRMAKMTKGPILETGSGLTTVVMACAGAEVHSLEHDFGWRERITGLLAQHGLTAHVHYAPMRDYGEFVWYSVPDGLPESFAMVECDGPTRDYGRSGLFRIMADRIKGADWIMDDVDDGGQLAILENYAVGREIHVLGTDGQKKFAIAKAA